MKFMKITIDTKTDTSEDIRKTIQLLENLMNTNQSTIVEESQGMFNMFSEDKQETTEEKELTPEKKIETFDVKDLLDT